MRQAWTAFSPRGVAPRIWYQGGAEAEAAAQHGRPPQSQGAAAPPASPAQVVSAGTARIAKFIDQVAAILAQDGLTVTVEPLPAAEAA